MLLFSSLYAFPSPISLVFCLPLVLVLIFCKTMIFLAHSDPPLCRGILYFSLRGLSTTLFLPLYSGLLD